MKLSRRTFVWTSGGVAGCLLTNNINAQITEYSTLESKLIYEIEHGRQNPIHITEGIPPLPTYPPNPIEVEWGNLVIKWEFQRKQETPPPADCVICDAEPVGELPQWINLWLFKPRATVTDVTGILQPPQYAGHGPKGHYILRYPAGDDTFPVKEDTPLWQDYIQPSWEPVSGAQVEVTDSMLPAEIAHTTWPGNRSLAKYTYPTEGMTPAKVALRVATQSLGDQEALLVLLEIKKKGRLRLMARPMLVEPIISDDTCFIATAAYGSSDTTQVVTLRRWRDMCLSQSAIGRVLIRAYYAVSPGVAAVVRRSEILRSTVRYLLNPLVRAISKRLS